MRHCEICGSNGLDPIYRQNFLFPGQAAPVHYDVVACRVCGFAFASDIPDQSSLNQFYETSEHHLHSTLPPGLARVHGDFFSFVRQHVALSPDSRILDIGSGMGHFLQHFRRAGIRSLLGIEPSPAAARLADEFYGIEIQSATIDTFSPSRKFDLVTLCGVLEHIADLNACAARIAALLPEGGHVFIAVPDASTFGTSPPVEAFLEFALEHINFFSETSLDNLLGKTGLQRVASESQANDFYGNSYLLGLYRKSADIDSSIQRDENSARSIGAYVEHSRRRLQPTISRIDKLIETQEPVIVWGAGSLTSRLFCDTRLKDANIRLIVDKNKNLQGKKLLEFSIVPPESITEHPGATIFVASTSYADEITEALIEQYRWTGDIVTISPGR